MRHMDRRTNALQTNRPTNQLTNQPTDTASYRGALAHLKSERGIQIKTTSLTENHIKADPMNKAKNANESFIEGLKLKFFTRPSPFFLFNCFHLNISVSRFFARFSCWISPFINLPIYLSIYLFIFLTKDPYWSACQYVWVI